MCCSRASRFGRRQASRSVSIPLRGSEMQLKSVRVTNFRCVLDSTEFTIDPITCLVGKNEAGKSTVLHALRALNDYENPAMSYDKDNDYPRLFVNDYAERHGDEPAEVLHTSWELSNEDVNAVEAALCEGALGSRMVSVKRAYGATSNTWDVNIAYAKIIAWLATKYKVTGSEAEDLAKHGTVNAALKWIESLGDAASAELKEVAKHILTWNGSATSAVLGVLTKLLPKFLYFGSYDQMSGKVALQQLQTEVANGQLTQANRVFLAFLEFAGIPLADIPKLTTFETLSARMEGASNSITKQLFEYWTQNKFLRVIFANVAALPGDPPPFNNGWILRTRIYNELHMATVDFDDRSTGFVWFFSFLVLFSQVKKQHGNVIILLDEPGLSLHGRAQGDLLRYFREKLEPKHQVIYTTHSPFMVQPDKLTSVRTVEDVVEYPDKGKPIAHGTKVSDKVLSTDADTTFPLQGALGYEITQTLFVGKHTLLVEGPGDVLMLQAASGKLKELGRIGLDERWILCPVGGIGKVTPFVGLFGSNDLDVAVLADFALNEKDNLERLRASEILERGRVLTVDSYCGQAEADSEDLFGATLYAAMVNGAYKLKGKNQLTADSIAAVSLSSPRIVKRVEAIFKSGSLPGSTPAFDHYSPAYWLQRNPDVWDVDGVEAEKALDRFEQLFKDLNAFLPAG